MLLLLEQKPFYSVHIAYIWATETLSLHIFVDASKHAHGVAAFLCDDQHSGFVMAKSRVAPVKTLTMTRLELMSAVIGVRLAKHVEQAINIKETHFWSDSQIVLHWKQ